MVRRDVTGGLASLVAGVAAVLLAHGAAAQVRDAAPRPTLRQECVACHPRAHDRVLGSGKEASGKCGDCHVSVHQAIQALYAGTGPGQTVRPDPMYAAHVRCAACHTDSTFAYHVGLDRLAAIDDACVSCHGPRFKGMVLQWSDALTWRARAVSEYVTRAAADSRLTKPAARRALQSARQSLLVIANGGGLHNLRGADALLRSARDSAAAAYLDNGVAPPSRLQLGPDPRRDDCVGCHYGIESMRDSAFGRAFDHAPHVVRAELACTDCHSSGSLLTKGKPDADRTHGQTTLVASSCEQCHHAADQTASCAACHADDTRLTKSVSYTLPLTLQSKNGPASRAVAFPHAKHSSTACSTCHSSRTDVRRVSACAACHQTHHEQAADCSSCHGVQLLSVHTADSHFTCTSCHPTRTVALLTPNRAFCSSCHVGFADHQPGLECTTCHMQGSPADIKKRIVKP